MKITPSISMPYQRFSAMQKAPVLRPVIFGQAAKKNEDNRSFLTRLRDSKSELYHNVCEGAGWVSIPPLMLSFMSALFLTMDVPPAELKEQASLAFWINVPFAILLPSIFLGMYGKAHRDEQQNPEPASATK